MHVPQTLVNRCDVTLCKTSECSEEDGIDPYQTNQSDCCEQKSLESEKPSDTVKGLRVSSTEFQVALIVVIRGLLYEH